MPLLVLVPLLVPRPLPVYDGSWTEWGAEDSGCPVDGK